MNKEVKDLEEEYKCKGQTVICPRCRREHFSPYLVMDEYVNCECGFRFYAFADRGLNIIMTPEEVGYEPVARAMRRFIVSTGRCTDIPPSLYLEPSGSVEYDVSVEEKDLDTVLEETLEEYQATVFGQCYLTRELICSIYDSFESGHDVELKKQKDRVDVIELKKKKIADQSIRQHARPLAYNEIVSPIRRSSHPLTGGVLLGSQEYRRPSQL